MRDDLFFVPLLADALRQPNQKDALREAFGRIESLGRLPAYRRGFTQFRRFMQDVSQAEREAKIEPLPTRKTWPWDRPDQLELLIERDRRPVATVFLAESACVRPVANVTAGHYRISTETGWLIWEGDLTPQEVVWSKAYPGEPLRMAAESDTADRRPTRTIRLLAGSLTLSVLAGLESGWIELRFTAPQDRP